MQITSFLNILLGLLFAPLLLGIINKTKASFAGRTGQPLLQAYYDIIKQLQKGAVYSKTTSWIFRAGPVVGLSAIFVALAIVPLGGIAAPLAFSGDLLLLGLHFRHDAFFYSYSRIGYRIKFRRHGSKS